MKFFLSFPVRSILLAIGFFLMACTDIDKIKETTTHYQPSVERGGQIQMYYSLQGNLQIELLAPSFIRYQTDDPHIEFPDGLIVYFYDNMMNKEGELKANYGIRYEKQGKTFFRDSVYVENIRQETIFTDELIWDENEEKIYSEKFVKMITPDERITGTGFEANQDLTNYKVLNITGIINVETSENDEDF